MVHGVCVCVCVVGGGGGDGGELGPCSLMCTKTFPLIPNSWVLLMILQFVAILFKDSLHISQDFWVLISILLTEIG